MMIDKELTFADGQGPFNIGTNASTNHLDRTVDSDIGKGELLWGVVIVTEAVAGGTLNIRLVTDDEATFTGPTVLWETSALAAASFPIGTVYRFRLPSGFLRYTRFEFVVASANQTTGKYFAAFVSNVDDYKTYPRANYVVA